MLLAKMMGEVKDVHCKEASSIDRATAGFCTDLWLLLASTQGFRKLLARQSLHEGSASM